MIWTEAQDQTLIALREEGWSASEIGAKIGVSRNAVLGRSLRLNLPPLVEGYVRTRKKEIVPSVANLKPWTQDDDDMLAKMRADGLANWAIALHLKRSSRSVSNRVQCLGLPRKKHVQQDRAYGTSFGPSKKKEVKPPQHFVPKTAPGSSPVPLIYRTGCCYPVTDEKPHKFCNEPADGSYCEFHRSIMYHKRAA